jgi:hypothetical protein
MTNSWHRRSQLCCRTSFSRGHSQESLSSRSVPFIKLWMYPAHRRSILGGGDLRIRQTRFNSHRSHEHGRKRRRRYRGSSRSDHSGSIWLGASASDRIGICFGWSRVVAVCTCRQAFGFKLWKNLIRRAIFGDLCTNPPARSALCVAAKSPKAYHPCRRRRF